MNSQSGAGRVILPRVVEAAAKNGIFIESVSLREPNLSDVFLHYTGRAILGLQLNPLMFLETLPIMILITFGLVSIGLTVASFMESLESFGVIQSFINLPLFFLSGAIFPIGAGVPTWLQAASSFNLLTYGVDALRAVILGSAWSSLHPLYYNLLIICVFGVAMITIGTLAFSRRK